MISSKFPDIAEKDDLAKLRQIQLDGRRHAISIEPIYWECLQSAADELGLRLNQLVVTLARAEEGPNNLAARLRLFCIRRLRRQLGQARLAPSRFNLADLINAAPSPCFAVRPDRRIVHANDALGELVGEEAKDIVGDPADKFFRIRFPQPLADVWARFTLAGARAEQGSIAMMIPGKLSVRRMTACPIKQRGSGNFLALIYLR